MAAKKEPIKWITVNGHHVPIFDEQEKSLADKVKQVNPNFKKDASIYDKEGYNNNCVQCALAMEAALRGEDVEANPFEFGNPDYVSKSKSIHAAFGLRRGDVWDVGKENTKGTVAEIEYLMEDFGEGSRAVIQCESKGMRHTMNVINDNGTIIFIDAQRGMHGDGKKVLKGINTAGMGLVRTDDRNIDPEYASWAYRRRK